MTGKFITVEGVEGAGKSTALAFIQQFIINQALPLVVTREPGGTDISEKIRALLLDPQNQELNSDAELLLMFAARAQHLGQLIIPALKDNKWVLCDRFTDATFAYQGAGRGIGYDKIAHLETFVQGDLRPDLTILLDISPDLGLQRVLQRGSLDRFEKEKIHFFEQVRNCYLKRVEQFPERFRVIDASQSIENVQGQIAKVLDVFIKQN